MKASTADVFSLLTTSAAHLPSCLFPLCVRPWASLQFTQWARGQQTNTGAGSRKAERTQSSGAEQRGCWITACMIPLQRPLTTPHRQRHTDSFRYCRLQKRKKSVRLKVEAKQRQQGRAAGGTTFHLNSANRNGASLKEAERASCTLTALHRSTVTKKEQHYGCTYWYSGFQFYTNSRLELEYKLPLARSLKEVKALRVCSDDDLCFPFLMAQRHTGHLFFCLLDKQTDMAVIMDDQDLRLAAFWFRKWINKGKVQIRI